ncbi:MAG: hypothetical protein QOH67_4808 [Hyphomicrobiales bacterium]|jgi:hypothetical protein|nr:hypothetical protein [Hyphomicrobiales bacterium]
MLRAACLGGLSLLLVTSVTTIGNAHDLRGLNQHFKHKKKSAGQPAGAAAAEKVTNFQALREIATAAAAPDFDLSKHIESKGLAGAPLAVVQGIALKTSRWPDFHQLTVCFFDGPPQAQKNVMSVYSEILSHTTLSAMNVGKCDPKKKTNIRVSFATGEGYWSFVGLESQTVPQTEPTMGLDGLGLDGALPEASMGVIRHEVLHSVGFEHEHQRPDVNCKFKSVKELAKLMGWSEADVKTNFDRMKPSPSLLLTKFDRDSEMLYQLDGRFFTDAKSPCMISDANNKLSPTDITTLKLLYVKPAPHADLQMMLQK